MTTLLATTAACLGLYNGAGWSQERSGGQIKHAGSNGWPAEALLDLPSDYAKQPTDLAILGDLRSLPAAVRMERAPSVLDVMQDKWFGSLSTSSSLYNTDSSGGISPSERRRRQAAGTISNEVANGSAPWHRSSQENSATSSRSQGGQGSDKSRPPHSSHSSHSSSRSITQQRGAHSNQAAADSKRFPVLSQLDGLSTPLTPALLENPRTPDWLHDGALSVSESGCDTPHRHDSFSTEQALGGTAVPTPGRHFSAHPPARQPSFEEFGTWAGRQRHFGAAASRLCPDENPDAVKTSSDPEQGRRNSVDLEVDDSGDLAEGEPLRRNSTRCRAIESRMVPGSLPTAIPGATKRPIPKPGMATARAGGEGSADSSFDEDRARNAAWRWRFGRRWRAEQAKQLDPTYGQELGDEDTWDEALGYLEACGGGYHLQIARTTSVDRSLGHSVLGSGQMLLDESYTADEPLADAADLDATKRIGAMAKKAAELMQHQQEIEKRVSQRWGDVSAAGDSWAGQYLPAVEIDTYGSFPFVLLKVADRTGVNKLLVRGKNYSSENGLLQAAHQEVAEVCTTRRVPPVTLELIGSGTMDWSRERDRYLNCSEGRVVMGSHTSVQTRGDVARLAGALTRCSLPMHYHITVEGQKLM